MSKKKRLMTSERNDFDGLSKDDLVDIKQNVFNSGVNEAQQ